MNSVVVYTKPGCGPCAAVKKFLDKSEMSYVEKGPEEAAEQGYKSVPVTVGFGRTVFGFDLPGLLNLRDFYNATV